jgi:hypothetical protein
MSLENMFLMLGILLIMLIFEMVRLRCKVERLETILSKEADDEAKKDLL